MPRHYGSRREEILRLKKEGWSNSSIGLKLGISRQRVSQIANGDIKLNSVRMGPRTLLSTGQLARILNVHVNTVRRWSDGRLLPTYRIGLRGDRRFRWSDVLHLLREGFISDMPRIGKEPKGIDEQSVLDHEDTPQEISQPVA